MTIPERLAELRQSLAANDRLILAPPLSEEQVLAFERANGVVLPDDYREFVRSVANGITVRREIYHIFPLDHWLDDAPGLARPGTPVRGDLRRPFPLTAAVDFEEDGYPEPGEGPAGDGTAPGKLFVSDEGCGTSWILVVTGPERGHMWLEAEAGYQPTEPRMSFLDWLAQWADTGWRAGLTDLCFPLDPFAD